MPSITAENSNAERFVSMPRAQRAACWLSLGLISVVASPAVAANFTVLVGSGGLVYVPASLTVTRGDTVTFRNAGGLHNVDADDHSFRCANGCDNDGKGGNGNPSTAIWQATVAFNSVGTFGYFCDTHGSATSGMRGQIVVTDSVPVRLQSFEVD